jgi:hypothetical protein
MTRMLLLLALLIQSGIGAAGDAEFRTIDLRHRSATEVLPVIQPLLDPGGRVAGHEYQLFVRTSDRNFAEIARTIREVDIPLRTLRISLRYSDSLRTTDAEQAVSIHQGGTGTTRILVSPTATRGDGVVLRRTGPGGMVEYRSEHHTSSRGQDTAQFVSVLEGRRAYIAVGASLPQVQPFLALAGDRLRVAVGITYYDVSTGFSVLPRLHGETVELEISPRLAFRSNQGDHVVDFAELSTQIRVRLGEWVDVGSSLSATNQMDRAILSGSNGSADERLGLQLRVD